MKRVTGKPSVRRVSQPSSNGPWAVVRGPLQQDLCSQLLSLFVSTIQVVRRSIIALGHRLRGLTLSHSPSTSAHGQLLQRRETRLADGYPVTRLMLFKQAVANQKPKAAFANLDRRDHGHTP